MTERRAAGNPDAFKELYDRYGARVFAVALRILRDRAEAEEVVQEVFLQVWQQRGRYDASRGAIGTWLAMIARSRAIDRLRVRRARGVEAPSRPAAEPAMVPPEASGEADMARAVRQAMTTVPAMQRLVLELLFFGGYTHLEIARLLNQPLGTVKTRARLALSKMRDALERTGPARAGTGRDETPFTQALTEYLTGRYAAFDGGANLTGVRVLVVDDDADTCDLLAVLLERAGARVVRVRSASAAIEQLAVDWPDVLLADVMMPDVDGYALMRRARRLSAESRRPLRAAAFTALAGEQDRAAAIKAGFEVHLAKPVPPQEIVRVVAALTTARA